MKASARVIYRSSWATDRPAIMAAHGWETSNSEVLISTPRRFGKTFRRAEVPTPISRAHADVCSRVLDSIAIFCACLALAQGLEIGAPQSVHPSCPLAHMCSLCAVVFSPARRASRKLLERIVEWPVAVKPRLLGACLTLGSLLGRFVTLAGGKDKICEYNQARWDPAPAARRAAADPHCCGNVRRRLAG